MENDIVIVTGASGGIGAAIAQAFAKDGAFVCLGCSSSRDKADRLAAMLNSGRECAFVYQFDVTDGRQVTQAVAEIADKFGKIDVLVNNAGITRDGLLMRMSDDDFCDVIDTNLKSVFNMSKACIPYMLKKRKGSIVNMSSVVGIMGNAGQTNYASSKAGIIGFTKSLAREVASRNITVNAVAPGAVDTAMFSVIPDEIRKKIVESIPLGRVAEPAEVASAVLFLSHSPYITGQVLQIDGGMGI